MTSLLAAEIGSQAPTLLVRPPEAVSALDECLAICDIAGLVLDPWQVTAVGSMLGEDEYGRWAATECGLDVPRQNGKGGVLEARALYELFIVGADRPNHLIIWTAHEFKTAQEAFLRMKTLIINSPALMKNVSNIRNANGEEGFELANGARLRFVARGKNSGRGFSADLLILDEAQVLPAAMIRATMPTLSARPNPQIIYAGTPPETGGGDATHWVATRKRAHSDKPGRLAWVEWATEIPDGIGPDELLELAADPERWRAANPAMGIRLTEEFTRTEFDAMVAANDLAGFMRERLGVWPEAVTDEADRIISADDYGAAVERGALPGVEHVGPVVLSVDGSPSTGGAAIVAVGECSTGGLLIELVDARGGVGWVPGRVVELVADHDVSAVVFDERGPLRSVSTELLEAADGRGRELGTAEVVDASMRLARAFSEGRVVVAASPELAEAAMWAKARKVGEGWAIERRVPVSVAPMVAASFGVLIAETEPHGSALDQILV